MTESFTHSVPAPDLTTEEITILLGKPGVLGIRGEMSKLLGGRVPQELTIPFYLQEIRNCIPNKERDKTLVEQYVSQVDSRLSIHELSGIYRPEIGGTVPLEIVIDHRIVTSIYIATDLREDGGLPHGAMFPVTLEKVKGKLSQGWTERNALDKKNV